MFFYGIALLISFLVFIAVKCCMHFYMKKSNCCADSDNCSVASSTYVDLDDKNSIVELLYSLKGLQIDFIDLDFEIIDRPVKDEEKILCISLEDPASSEENEQFGSFLIVSWLWQIKYNEKALEHKGQIISQFQDSVEKIEDSRDLLENKKLESVNYLFDRIEFDFEDVTLTVWHAEEGFDTCYIEKFEDDFLTSQVIAIKPVK